MLKATHQNTYSVTLGQDLKNISHEIRILINVIANIRAHHVPIPAKNILYSLTHLILTTIL